ncbi:hypothetical protein EVAR_41052_1 [Eumeta japonica]|uniref:unspecific monooxygenase n=1 Tax=Eumeta variegata TaxID=151549 RepID=A0A4C1XVK3_EUMVA|nr:hypothetical protein EVAR_41052_1 [Eumeta japonica]
MHRVRCAIELRWERPSPGVPTVRPLSVHAYRRDKAIRRRDRTRQPVTTPQLVTPLESVKQIIRLEGPAVTAISAIAARPPGLPLFTMRTLLSLPQNIEAVLTGDFNTFNDRGVDIDGRMDVLNDNVTFMNGIRWKLTRQTLTPLFTAAKLRNMYYILDKSGRDFVDYIKKLCVELQRKGTLRDVATGYEIEPTDEVMAAQAFFFFIAGVEPSATAMFFALFELAKHPDILDKLREEVDDVFERCDDNPTYEAVNDMKYLDMVLDESMRIHPAVGNLQRRCTKNGGVLPVGKIDVEKVTVISIPVYFIGTPSITLNRKNLCLNDLATKGKKYCKLHVHALRRRPPHVYRSQRTKKNNRQSTIILHHDNASCHTSTETTRFLERQKVELTGHPPYSPDLAPNDFYLSQA